MPSPVTVVEVEGVVLFTTVAVLLVPIRALIDFNSERLIHSVCPSVSVKHISPVNILVILLVAFPSQAVRAFLQGFVSASISSGLKVFISVIIRFIS